MARNAPHSPPLQAPAAAAPAVLRGAALAHTRQPARPPGAQDRRGDDPRPRVPGLLPAAREYCGPAVRTHVHVPVVRRCGYPRQARAYPCCADQLSHVSPEGEAEVQNPCRLVSAVEWVQFFESGI